MPISRLSKATGLAMNTLTSMLDRMEASGIVRRDRGDHDRRKILIYLTESAKALEKDYNAVTSEIEDIYYKGFSTDEIESLEGYLRRVLSNVEEVFLTLIQVGDSNRIIIFYQITLAYSKKFCCPPVRNRQILNERIQQHCAPLK